MPEPAAGPLGLPAYQTVPAKSQGLGQGSVDVLVYIDDNNTMDDGEQPVQGVSIRNARTGQLAETNAKGVARVTNLLPGTRSRIQVATETIPDLYLKPLSEWHTLLANQGHGGQIKIALQRRGEVAGVVAGHARYSHITLLNAKGKVVESTQTAGDGSFYFSDIPMGAYTAQARTADGNHHAITTFTLDKQKPVALDLLLQLP